MVAPNPSDVEILVHIAAPGHSTDDKRYRSFAAAYLDFDALSRHDVHTHSQSQSRAPRNPSPPLAGDIELSHGIHGQPPSGQQHERQDEYEDGDDGDGDGDGGPSNSALLREIAELPSFIYAPEEAMKSTKPTFIQSPAISLEEAITSTNPEERAARRAAAVAAASAGSRSTPPVPTSSQSHQASQEEPASSQLITAGVVAAYLTDLRGIESSPQSLRRASSQKPSSSCQDMVEIFNAGLRGDSSQSRQASQKPPSSTGIKPPEEPQLSWVARPSVIEDSNPDNDVSIAMFNSPTRILERYLVDMESPSQTQTHTQIQGFYLHNSAGLQVGGMQGIGIGRRIPTPSLSDLSLSQDQDVIPETQVGRTIPSSIPYAGDESIETVGGPHSPAKQASQQSRESSEAVSDSQPQGSQPSQIPDSHVGERTSSQTSRVFASQTSRVSASQASRISTSQPPIQAEIPRSQRPGSSTSKSDTASTASIEFSRIQNSNLNPLPFHRSDSCPVPPSRAPHPIQQQLARTESDLPPHLPLSDSYLFPPLPSTDMVGGPNILTSTTSHLSFPSPNPTPSHSNQAQAQDHVGPDNSNNSTTSSNATSNKTNSRRLPPQTGTPPQITYRPRNSLTISSPTPPCSLAPLTPSALITPRLQKLDQDVSLRKRYRPLFQKRELRPFERGYWDVDTSTWSPGLRGDCWTFLQNFVAGGFAGWGVRCVREDRGGAGAEPGGTGARGESGEDGDGDTPMSGADPSTATNTTAPSSSENKPLELHNKWMRVYCWGAIVGHVYLLLYLASKRQVLVTGTEWCDGDNEVVVEMRKRRSRKGVMRAQVAATKGDVVTARPGVVSEGAAGNGEVVVKE